MAGRALRPLIAGNWKMNGLTSSLREVRLLAGMLKGVRLGCDVMVCPPATLMHRAYGLLRSSRIKLGGQDCHPEASGAHTGDVSAEMLKDAGCSAVIVGHSERRTGHGENDELVAAKAAAAHRAGLSAIICIGETLEERKAGKTLDIVTRQLAQSLPGSAVTANTIIAYEPVWAIGTGLTPTMEEIAEVHGELRNELSRRKLNTALLYGGSVKPGNAAEILKVENVNGALVGGASLKASDFIGIIKAYA